MENIVYLELLRRGYNVYIGKANADTKIYFVCEKDGKKLYIQVSYKLDNEKTTAREMTPLLNIVDNYPKYIITMDKIWNSDHKGIKKIILEDFLLNELD